MENEKSIIQGIPEKYMERVIEKYKEENKQLIMLLMEGI